MSMTPKEKAIELVSKFSAYTLSYRNEFAAKQCSLIAVDEIMKYHPISTTPDERETNFLNFWLETKTEIENL